jgi:hypothetical protein
LTQIKRDENKVGPVLVCDHTCVKAEMPFDSLRMTARRSEGVLASSNAHTNKTGLLNCGDPSVTITGAFVLLELTTPGLDRSHEWPLLGVFRLTFVGQVLADCCLM